jgi:DNA polymerase-3 subunit delta'
MLFKEVIGQPEIKQHLLEVTNSGKIPHAQLFLSQPGAGALALALAFTQYVVCENKTESDSCGVCGACVKAQKMIHPDIHYTYPIVPKKPSPSPSLSTDYIVEWRKEIIENPYINELEFLQAIGAENKQGNISADEARNILNGLKLTTFEATYKIQIIWMAEALSKEGNILLKLLEEPPENTLLILIAENQEEILPTILSRCQVVKINKIDDDSVASELLKKGVPTNRAKHIAYLADGNYNEALKLIDSSTSIETIRLTELLKYAIRMQEGTNAGALVKWADDMSKIGRENLKSFLEYLLHILRETLQMKFAPNAPIRLTDDEQKTAQALIKYTNLNKLSDLLELISKKHYEIERNVSPKMVLLDMALKLNKIILSKE